MSSHLRSLYMCSIGVKCRIYHCAIFEITIAFLGVVYFLAWSFRFLSSEVFE